MRPLRPILGVIVCAVLAHAPVAHAAWSTAGTGGPTSKALTMPAGNAPIASVSNRSVTVSWTASTFSNGGAISGYVVKRYDASGNAQTIGSGCSGTISGLSCTETSVPGGTWAYSVTPVHSNWTGTEGSRSASVTVSGPSLTFSSSTTLTALPTTLTGSIASFVGGQTVTFRLDDPSTGTVLSSSLSPTPVPSGGGSSITVTVPAGTANGSHTVYAVGSAGDVVGAGVTVDVTYTAASTAWDLRDASSGTESNVSAQSAFADGITFQTGLLPINFSPLTYFEFNPNASLPDGFSVSGASFNLRLAAGAAGDSACYWFEVRRASTGALVGTHGSTSAPAACVTGTTQQTTTTPLSELNTTALANDARIRVYGRESGAKPFTIDMATVTGSTPLASFTLYSNTYTDVTAGVATTTPWSLVSNGDGTPYTTTSNWLSTFNSARYLKLSFPAYVPSGATITGATLTHSYRPASSGRNACYYAEVYAGSTLIGTHGSSSAPYSCNSTSTYTTDPIPLPEVNTAARANSAVVKLYFDISGSGTRTTQHDYAQLSVSYK